MLGGVKGWYEGASPGVEVSSQQEAALSMDAGQDRGEGGAHVSLCEVSTPKVSGGGKICVGNGATFTIGQPQFNKLGIFIAIIAMLS